MRRSHDDQMRGLRLAHEENGKISQPFSSDTAAPEESPVKLTRELVDAAIARSRDLTKHEPPIRRDQRDRFILAQGSMTAFLRKARVVQNLPHFAQRMRS